MHSQQRVGVELTRLNTMLRQLNEVLLDNRVLARSFIHENCLFIPRWCKRDKAKRISVKKGASFVAKKSREHAVTLNQNTVCLPKT